MSELEPTPADPVERLRAASQERRRLVVRGLSLTFGVLSLLVLMQGLVHPLPVGVTLVNVIAAACFGGTYLLVRAPGDPTRAAVSVLSAMLAQQVGSALLVHTTVDVGSAIMFSGLIPLIAAVTLGVRGVLWWIALPVVGAAVAFFGGVQRGLEAAELSRHLAAPVFFILVAGSVALMAARAEAHAAAAEREREQKLQRLSASLESTRRLDALGRLAGGVAHDFNNMLSVIRACASMLRRRAGSDERVAHDLTLIDDAVDGAARLTGQLLSFARRQVVEPGRVAPAGALARLLPLLERSVGANIELTLEANESTWRARIDDGRIEQVITNLAVNARDAMPRGGGLRIVVEDVQLAEGAEGGLPAGEYVRIDVQDSGDGIPPELQSRIFEPFFTTKDGSEGVGLGLATCYGIARQAAGNLRAVSPEGAGTTFILHLPRAPEGSVDDAPAATSARDIGGLRVLVVDDERPLRETLAELLRALGAIPVTASDPEAALRAASEDHFDAVISDVVLGRDDGLETLQQLRERQPAAVLVAMSGYMPAPERLTALRARGIGYLAKPFTESELVAALGGGELAAG